jgi:uncharacterized membrane protein
LKSDWILTLLAVPNLGTWEPYLPQTEKTQKYTPQDNTIKENIRCVKWVWWSKNITRNRNKMIYSSMVKSVLIYGAETWNLYEDDRRRINENEMDALRRSARI